MPRIRLLPRATSVRSFAPQVRRLAAVVAVALSLAAASAAGPAPTAKRPVAIGVLPQGPLPHLVRPRDEVAARQMEDLALPARAEAPTAPGTPAAPPSAGSNFAKQSRVWNSPEQERLAREREAVLAREARAPGGAARGVPAVATTVLALAVDFGSTETLSVWARTADNTGWALQSRTFSGPLHGQMAPPGAGDNNTIWYRPDQTADPAFYRNLIFGYAGVGRVRMDLTDPTDGQPGIDLTGYTVQDYYDRVAGPGNVTISGTVQGWVTVPHSEAYYGAPYIPTRSADGGAALSPDGAQIPVEQLVVDAVDAYNAAHPGFDWSAYDTNHDGFVDSLWIVHAGAGQESGGGAQGANAIWSHSWDLRSSRKWPDGYVVQDANLVANRPEIRVGPYTMQPENLGVGVLCEEFGHNFFGLPDLYTVDVANSVGFWSIMSAGAWGGPLGGAIPVGMPLWFRMIATTTAGPCNWQEPMVTHRLADPAEDVTIGQLEAPPAGTVKGVQLVLPDQETEVGNAAGSGKCLATGSGRDNLAILIQRPLTLPAQGACLLEIASAWNIENGYDFGYVMVNGRSIGDVDGFTDSYPLNTWHGLTGYGFGTLRFDLSAHRGETIQLGLYYTTDVSVTYPGWWVDDLRLDGWLVDDFERAIDDATVPGWTGSSPGWHVAPYTVRTPHYYLAEWRGDTRYDSSLRTAYVTSRSTSTTWTVERIPYNTPGALLYYRNARYDASYYLTPSAFDPPSIGPKAQLLVVDMHCQPLVLAGTQLRLDTAGGSYDAALALQPAQSFTLSGLSGTTGTWTFDPLPAVTAFDDRQGYFAGVFVPDPPDGNLYWTNQGGSCVIPARGVYSTAVTHADGSPAPEYYGQYASGLPLGTGNPADARVQYGALVELVAKSAAGDSGVLRFSKTAAPISVAGAVRTASGDAVASVTLAADRAGGRCETDGAGNYLLDLVPGWTGHIVPSAPGYYFVPSQIALTSAGQRLTGRDFTALPLPDDPSPYYDFRYLFDGATPGVRGADYVLEEGGIRTLTASTTSATLRIVPTAQYRHVPASQLPPVRFVRHTGALRQFVTEADVLSLLVDGQVNTITARNAHIGSVSVGGMRRLSMSDPTPAADSPAAWARTSVWSNGPLQMPLRIDLTGVILQSLDTTQKVASLRVAAKRTPGGVAPGGIGNVTDDSPLYFARESTILLPSLGHLAARGASIRPWWIWCDENVGPIEATALTVDGTPWGGTIGTEGDEMASVFYAPNFTSIRGETGVHATFVAGPAPDGLPRCTGTIRRIATRPDVGTLTGAAYVKPGTKIRFVPGQGAFKVHTAP